MEGAGALGACWVSAGAASGLVVVANAYAYADFAVWGTIATFSGGKKAAALFEVRWGQPPKKKKKKKTWAKRQMVLTRCRMAGGIQCRAKRSPGRVIETIIAI